jgi:hypothetical protein
LKTRELVSEILRGGSEELDLKLCQRELVMRGMKNPADMRRILSALRSANEGVDRVAEVVLGICADIATSSEGSRGSRKRRVGRIMRVLGP